MKMFLRRVKKVRKFNLLNSQTLIAFKDEVFENILPETIAIAIATVFVLQKQ